MSPVGMGTSEYGPDFGRPPPHDLVAEQAVLGAMMIDAQAIATALELLTAEDFYREAHRRWFRGAVRVFESGQTLDVVTWSAALRDSGELDAAGGLDALGHLCDVVPTAANVEYHAQVVRDMAARRRILEQCSLIVRDIYDPGDDGARGAIASRVQTLLDVIDARSSSAAGFRWIKDLLWAAFESLERMQESSDGITGLATGFPDLDRMTAGFDPGDLVVIAGRPSMGKTAFACDVARNLAVGQGKAVGISSLEMSADQLMHRLLAAEGRLDLVRMRRGKMSQEEHHRLASAAAHLNTAPLWIDDEPVASVVQLRAKARAWSWSTRWRRWWWTTSSSWTEPGADEPRSGRVPHQPRASKLSRARTELWSSRSASSVARRTKAQPTHPDAE